MKDFFEGIVESGLVIGTVFFIIGMIALNAFVMGFTLVVGLQGSPSVLPGFIVSIIVFWISKSLTCRVVLGHRGKDE